MPRESGGNAPGEAEASEPRQAAPAAAQGEMRAITGGAERPAAPESEAAGALLLQRPPQPQPPLTPFQLRAMLPASSSTSGSSPESTLSQRLPTLPGQEGGNDSTARPAPAVAGPLRGGRPPLPPAPARLPSAALLSGASSISIASPFMQQQISSALGSEGSSRWRSTGGFTSNSSSGPPSGAGPPAEAGAPGPEAAPPAAAANAAPPAEGAAPSAAAAEEAAEESAPAAPPEAEQAAWHNHMATVAEEEEEAEAAPAPASPREQQAAAMPRPAAPAVAPRPAEAAPAPPKRPAPQQLPPASARPGISDWGPLPDDVARLPPAQQAAVHAAAADCQHQKQQPRRELE
ncbi:hypothetical protein ABPG75_006749 [Micractinium tetrahymenae]